MTTAPTTRGPDSLGRAGAGLLAAAVLMYQRGLTTGTVGNVSVRRGDALLITPTRRYFDELTPEDLVSIPIEGFGDCVAPPNASREWRTHAAVYFARPDVLAVAHTHSPYAVARSFSSDPLCIETEERDYLGLDRVDVVPQRGGGSLELAELSAQCLRSRPACLLARHGVVAVAQTPRDAVELCNTVEHQAKIGLLVERSTSNPGSVRR